MVIYMKEIIDKIDEDINSEINLNFRDEDEYLELTSGDYNSQETKIYHVGYIHGLREAKRMIEEKVLLYCDEKDEEVDENDEI